MIIQIAKVTRSIIKDLLEKYGKPTAMAMVESAKRHIDILEELDLKYVINEYEELGKTVQKILSEYSYFEKDPKDKITSFFKIGQNYKI